MRQVTSQLRYIDLLNMKMSEHMRFKPAMRAWLAPRGRLLDMGICFDTQVADQATVVAWARSQLSDRWVVRPPVNNHEPDMPTAPRIVRRNVSA